MGKPLFIIKLGGSVITFKNQDTPRLRRKRLVEIAGEIKQAGKLTDFDLIIVAGAGSFGHPLAKKYDTVNGVHNIEQGKGFCEIKVLMNRMLTEIAGIFNRNGLPVFPCQTASLIIQKKGLIDSFNTPIIKNLLTVGAVPILSGDVATDLAQGGSICSGDAIIPYLAGVFKVEKILFASDVDGIFDKDPHRHKDAKLIPLVNSKNISQIMGQVGQSSNTDVTDGMRGKISKYQKETNRTPALIFNGLKKNSIKNALTGKQEGTEINL